MLDVVPQKDKTRCPERTEYPSLPVSPFNAQIVKLLPRGVA